jgi:pimeloyl-ACP methyl ester carboxylesterase
MNVFYLHGFASSAASSKASYFRTRLAEHGITLRTPDFNEPDFSTLTVTRMVDQVLAEMAALPPGPVALIGSSMGAFVAVQVAEKGRLPSTALGPGKAAPTEKDLPATDTDLPAEAGSHKDASEGGRYVERLVLLAPALDFARRRDFALGDRTHEEWKSTGVTNVFHYGYGRMIPVHYDLYADACGYECENVRLDLPILIFQGRRDTVVDPTTVEQWAARRPNVELHMLDDDHQLGASLEYMWDRVRGFLEL